MTEHFTPLDDDDEPGPSDYDDDEEREWEEDADDGPSRESEAEDEEEASARREQILAGADPDALDAHRDLLAAVLSYLDNDEEDLLRVAHRADVETLNPDEMSPPDLARLTQELAGSYPDALEAVTNRFPHAEKLLLAVLNGGEAQDE